MFEMGAAMGRDCPVLPAQLRQRRGTQHNAKALEAPTKGKRSWTGIRARGKAKKRGQLGRTCPDVDDSLPVQFVGRSHASRLGLPKRDNEDARRGRKNRIEQRFACSSSIADTSLESWQLSIGNCKLDVSWKSMSCSCRSCRCTSPQSEGGHSTVRAFSYRCAVLPAITSCAFSRKVQSWMNL